MTTPNQVLLVVPVIFGTIEVQSFGAEITYSYDVEVRESEEDE